MIMRISSLFVILLSFFSGSVMALQEKKVYGYIEKVTLVDKGLVLSAKLDTGAKSASLSAVNIYKFEKDNKTFIRFIVPSRSGDIEFVSEYVGRIKIKMRAVEKKLVGKNQTAIKRPVVLLRIMLDGKECTLPVNLTNRKRFNYPLLLGRDAIKAFDGIVDPSAAFTIKNHAVKK